MIESAKTGKLRHPRVHFSGTEFSRLRKRRRVGSEAVQFCSRQTRQATDPLQNYQITFGIVRNLKDIAPPSHDIVVANNKLFLFFLRSSSFLGVWVVESSSTLTSSLRVLAHVPTVDATRRDMWRCRERSRMVGDSYGTDHDDRCIHQLRVRPHNPRRFINRILFQELRTQPPK